MLSRRRVSLGALIAALLLALPSTVSAANPITVQVIVGQPCISGSGPANKPVVATLRTPDGHFRSRFRTRSDDFGGWGGCFAFDVVATFVNGGDRLRIAIGNKARSLVVPKLVPNIDRVGDVIEGSARPFSELSVGITHFKNFRNSVDHFYTVFADAQGNWQLDTTGDFNLAGGDTVTVLLFDGDDLFGAFASAPYVLIGHGDNFLTGSVNHRTRLEFLLSDASANEKAHVNAGPILFGIYVVSMFDDEGDAAYPLGGDWLTSNLAGDAALLIPSSLLRGTASDDVVRGRCMPNAPYMLIVRNRAFFGKTNSSGRLVRDVTNRMNMRRGDDLRLLCMYPTGDIWARDAIAL